MRGKHLTLLSAVLVLSLSGCKEKNKENNAQKHTVTVMKDNPLLQESNLPYGTPDFSKIRNEDFKPALEYVLQAETEAIQAIADNPDAPTFENTLVAMEKAHEPVSRVSNVFNALTSAYTNDVLKELDAEMSARFAEHRDNITLNEKLFERIQTLYDQRESLGLDAEDLKLLEVRYQKFVKAGARLSDADKSRLRKINSRLASLENRFGQVLLEANNASALVVTDAHQLDGLSPGEINALKAEEKEIWRIPLFNTTQQSLTQSLTDRAVREELFNRSWKRTDGGTFSTVTIIQEIVKLRIEKAKLLGFPNYAAWNLQDTMVKTPETVEDFFAQLIPATVAAAGKEAGEIRKMIDKEENPFPLEPWDWNFYAEKVRKARYDLDENQIKPYFELKTVLEKGVFFAATRLYGITFEERDDIPVYHPDVLVYELKEEDGTPIGLFYGDYFARESKRGGAWMSNFRNQSKLLGQKPVIYNVCNYTKPATGEPALVTYDDVTTLFHEFGHALHGFFANQKYASISGTSVARDFVEYPSQANEHWALAPEVLKNYAVHYETGKPMPQELIDKIKKASTFNQGFAFGEVLAAAKLDFNFHTLDKAEENMDINAFEQSSLEADKLWMKNVPPRYRATFFNHVFGGGYASGYYAYLWTEMLALDTGEWFDENGGLTRGNGQRYRDMILSRGNTLEYKEAYKAFRGSDPKVDAILESRGLK
ncbi:M3 family metallopeptidase [Sinomicrobium soli]|uniref:M3 family metallopeptidase n=1 Tax=Sinomicrobium sp. N-1-3-6 TaxID=2219864 RepID=UPI000DCC4244|nr:M3 family metallopeptidase [Sinomicrobium sp. N-1-3-6]RAV28668.1 dipeptidyl carboxypeptidase II [Sinomicrobium sp. N-1-3-6]